MKSSIINFALSALTLVLFTQVNAQHKTKKYIRKNKNAQIISSVSGDFYARGIHAENEKVFTGNSNGSIYYFNLANKENQLLFQLSEFSEIRDLERTGEFLVGMRSSEEEGKIVRIHNNGETEIITNEMWKGLFLDAMDFNGKRGFMMGDPVDGKFSLFHTNDSGATWERCEGSIEAMEGEGGFAASGTNVKVLNDSTYTFISGGKKNRFFKTTNHGNNWSEVIIPFFPGESSGAFSMCLTNDSIGVIVGGDYLKPELQLNTAYYTIDGGLSWYNSVICPRGYRSCVYEAKGVFYACGRNGIDFSKDGGKNWVPFANGKFFALSSTNTHLIATLPKGTIQLFKLIEK
ncbi:MAG: hypothetical protein MK066_07410 [Crocinitomicaceae bacterium]|nr:hypothetical protein [Crocinitomicaceae bacterium]